MIRRLHFGDSSPGVGDNDFVVPFIPGVDQYMLLSVSCRLKTSGVAASRRMQLKVLDATGVFVMPSVMTSVTASANKTFHANFKATGVGSQGLADTFGMSGFGMLLVRHDDVVRLTIGSVQSGDQLTDIVIIISDVVDVLE